MSRSDGLFPSYRTINVSASDPPDDWNEGIRKCRKCGKSWPKVKYFSPSPCCDVEAGQVNGVEGPEISWPDAVKALLAARFEKYYEVWNEGVSDEQLMWLDTGDMAFSEHEYKEGLNEIDHLIDRVGGMSNAENSGQ